MTVVSANIWLIRIFAGVPWRRGVKRQRGNRKRRFQGFPTLPGNTQYVTFFALKTVCQVDDHLYNWLISCCRTSQLVVDRTARYRMQSSAKKRISEVTPSAMSLTYSRNNKGPRTVPWGTPNVTERQVPKLMLPTNVSSQSTGSRILAAT